MNAMAIQGIGLVGGFGCGPADFERALAVGSVPTRPAAFAGGEIPALLADTAPLERFVDKRALRRIDHFSRLALLGAHLALVDAGLPALERTRLGLIVATGYGATATTFAFLDTVLDGGDALASPTHFSSSVHNAAAAHTAILLGITGPNLTVSQFEMSVPSALLAAQGWLAEGRVDAVLFGGVDEACAVLRSCWGRFFPEPSDRIRPFEFDRQSAVPGEGAAFFLLTAESGTARYGRITGVRQGNAAVRPPLLDAASLYLLGADGHRECGANYPRHLPPEARCAAYAPVYGSLPAGPAFDLAVAALACRDDRLPEGEALAGRELCCLKFGRDDAYGWIRLRRE
mgnify:FL=1